MAIIGVTGNFGSGKTTFCKYLQEFGVFFINADEIVHNLYLPGKIGFKKICDCFGEEFVDAEKGVLRDKLREVVLRNPQKLIILNKLIHPLVLREAEKLIKGQHKFICIESFYFEKDFLGSLIDKVIFIDRKPSLIKAKRKNKWKITDINRFLKLRRSASPPKPRTERGEGGLKFQPVFPKTDFVVKNNGSLKDLKQKAHEIYRELS